MIQSKLVSAGNASLEFSPDLVVGDVAQPQKKAGRYQSSPGNNAELINNIRDRINSKKTGFIYDSQTRKVKITLNKENQKSTVSTASGQQKKRPFSMIDLTNLNTISMKKAKTNDCQAKRVDQVQKKEEAIAKPASKIYGSFLDKVVHWYSRHNHSTYHTNVSKFNKESADPFRDQSLIEERTVKVLEYYKKNTDLVRKGENDRNIISHTFNENIGLNINGKTTNEIFIVTDPLWNIITQYPL